MIKMFLQLCSDLLGSLERGNPGPLLVATPYVGPCTWLDPVGGQMRCWLLEASRWNRNISWIPRFLLVPGSLCTTRTTGQDCGVDGQS